MIRKLLLTPLLIFASEVMADTELKTTGHGQGVVPLSSVSILQWLLSCVMVIGIMVACLWLLKKSSLTPGGKHDLIRIVAWVSVTRTERILLVKAGSRYLLLGVTGQNVTLLTELSPQEVEEGLKSGASGTFSSRLQEAIAGRFARNNTQTEEPSTKEEEKQ